MELDVEGTATVKTTNVCRTYYPMRASAVIMASVISLISATVTGVGHLLTAAYISPH